MDEEEAAEEEEEAMDRRELVAGLSPNMVQ